MKQQPGADEELVRVDHLQHGDILVQGPTTDTVVGYDPVKEVLSLKAGGVRVVPSGDQVVRKRPK